MDKTALFQLSYGVYVVGALAGERPIGCVVNTAMQVTSSPMQISTTISKENYTHDIVKETGLYTVSILPQDVNMDIIGTFGFKSSRDTDKFAQFSYALDSRGIPYLKDDAVAFLGAKVVNTVDLGSHTLFVAEVEDGENLRKAEPMTYAYYHTVKNGTAPKAAPTYQEAEAPVVKGWKCSVCGYVHPHEELPADFRCPICGQPASVFVKL